ncbi:MAG TPA: endonuclease/exonuclease/phosphatase family protein [Lacunisphaera sp.]|jgi:endonuclease/exonuclease/phosphatase family metal-dependent hydrolase|nr:endonuclease/exonuclease/phosphatase family protein [Lacunisphaera sp.]
MRFSKLALFLLAAASAAFGADLPPLALKVMTYNLRFASEHGPNAWPARRPVMQALIVREAPDVFGTQEGLYPQLRDLAAGLPGYEWIGLGRAGGSKDEFAAVFYRTDRLEPVAFDHFWLSDTPEVIGSMTWGNHYRRMVTWVRFRDRPSGREFYFWNTHFDHQVEVARQKSAALIVRRLAELDPAVPLVLAGDFNSTAGSSRAYEILTQDGGLADTWKLAANRRNEDLDSFNDFKPGKHGGERIDWILMRPPASVDAAAVVDYDGLSTFPSDHFPVTATVRFP